MAKSACGPHIEIVSTDAIRVTRCPCGTMHVTMQASGVTVRLSAEALRGITAGLTAAVEKMDEPPAVTSTGSTSIN
jgi:hypothetical protein